MNFNTSQESKTTLLPKKRFHWTIHPLLDEPQAKSGLLITILLAISIAVATSFDSNSYGLLTFFLLSVSLSSYFLPTRYILDNQGITTSHLSLNHHIPWDRFHRACVYPDGVLLSPFSQPNRLDPFRGCFLKFGKHRDEIIHGIQTYIDFSAS